MARDPYNDVNIAQRPEHAKVCDALSKQWRARFPVQEFKPPPAWKKAATK